MLLSSVASPHLAGAPWVASVGVVNADGVWVGNSRRAGRRRSWSPRSTEATVRVSAERALRPEEPAYDVTCPGAALAGSMLVGLADLT